MEVAISELELQHELQRFTSRFVERITQGAEHLQHAPRADVREHALRKNLLYASSALEIATGPSAAINLLDMFVFVRLCRNVLESHWLPVLYGEDGRELVAAFDKAEDELIDVTERALGAEGHGQLASLVDAWIADNPRQTRVEGVRLADFAEAAGTAAANRALQARGLLSSMKVASEAANKAMVIAERGMFLFHRLPFLWRLHVRLAVRDLIGDALTRITRSGMVTGARRALRGATYVALIGGATAGVLWMRNRLRS
jgi:hypothetical protein